jgi:hypothetical protein
MAYSIGSVSDYARLLVAHFTSWQEIGFLQMEKKKVTIAGPIAVAGISVIPIIKVSVNCQPAGSSIIFSGVKQPISLVITSPSAQKAFDINGDEVQIGSLIQEVPDLAGVLELT